MGLPKDMDARKFSRVAKQRLDEAKTILVKAQLPAAAQYLGGYAVECMLKALVLTLTPRGERMGATGEQVREGAETINWMKRTFGHDLHSLRVAAAGRGVRMSQEVAGEFVFVATRNPQDRYELGSGDPRRAARFLEAAQAIVKWADERM